MLFAPLCVHTRQNELARFVSASVCVAFVETHFTLFKFNACVHTHIRTVLQRYIATRTLKLVRVCVVYALIPKNQPRKRMLRDQMSRGLILKCYDVLSLQTADQIKQQENETRHPDHVVIDER